MPHFRKVGDVPRKRHTQFRRADGGLFKEELMGEEGFVGCSSLLYHLNSPSEVIGFEPLQREPVRLAPNQPLIPRHLQPHRLKTGGDVVSARTPLLGNEDILLSYVASTEPSPLYRNAMGDELLYVESGSATLETVFGVLDVARGDYVVVPAGTTHRWLPTGDTIFRAVIFETSSHVTVPSRYLSRTGQLLESAPFCELDLRTPTEALQASQTEVEVIVKTRAGYTRYTYANHPFDVVGWFGCLYPWALNIWDFSPVTGSLHRPPPLHQTFEGNGFVICSFVPRLFDYDPNAVPVPPYHSNVDSDEVLFYADGDFMSRVNSGITQGSISMHPAGHIHGPHPGSVEAALGASKTAETAVMLDTFRPLLLADGAHQTEDEQYVWSWSSSR